MIIVQIYPHFGCPLQIVLDNVTEHVNKVMKETLAKLKIDDGLISAYHSQNNGKVERFHRTFHDVLGKKVADKKSWDLFPN